MKTLNHIALFAICLLAACASDPASQNSTAATGASRKKLSERLGEDNGYKQDADGNWTPQVGKRSEFDNMGESPNFKKNYTKQVYKTGDYAKKSWWGNKTYDRPAYDIQRDGSGFQKTSTLQGRSAREVGANASIPSTYRTGTYATGSAEESGSAPVISGTRSATENRQRVYEQVEIIDWKEQRGLTIEQSKSLLGN